MLPMVNNIFTATAVLYTSKPVPSASSSLLTPQQVDAALKTLRSALQPPSSPGPLPSALVTKPFVRRSMLSPDLETTIPSPQGTPKPQNPSDLPLSRGRTHSPSLSYSRVSDITTATDLSRVSRFTASTLSIINPSRISLTASRLSRTPLSTSPSLFGMSSHLYILTCLLLVTGLNT